MRSPVRLMRLCSRAALVAVVCLPTACTTVPPTPIETLAAFIVDGTTTRAEVVTELGLPANYFAGDRIAVYMLGYPRSLPAGYKWIPEVHESRPQMSGCLFFAECSKQLILQFDESERVVRHALR